MGRWVEYQRLKEYFNTTGGSWGGLQKFKPVLQRNNLFCIVTAYPHNSLLNLVTAFANEMYFFLDIFASEALSQLKILGTAYLQELAQRTAGNRPPIESEQQRWQKRSVENFCKTELPANPMHVTLYLQSLLNDCQQSIKSVSVIISAIYSIRWAHQTALMESPTEHILVKSVLNASMHLEGFWESL